MNTTYTTIKNTYKISALALCIFSFAPTFANDNPFTKKGIVVNTKSNTDSLSTTDSDITTIGSSSTGFSETATSSAETTTMPTFRVNNQQELLDQIEKIKETGGIILLKPGVDYGDLSVSGKSINDAHNIVLMTDPKYTEKAKIQGLRLHNSYNVKIMNIEFTGLADKPAVEVSATSGLNISNCEISGGQDGILVKGKYIFDENWKVIDVEKVQNINIKNNYIHDIQRDGIHVIQANGVFVQKNVLSSFHPNYEGMTQESFSANIKNSEKITIEGETVNRDHSDCIQITDSSRIAVTENSIDATGGAWNQSIFIKMENNQTNTDWIKVEDNNIKNDHPHGIRIHGFTKASQSDVESKNKLERVETIGSSNTDHTPIVQVD